MIYTVTYFNPLGNCDNIAYVEANNEVDAALIAHADFWVASKSFDLSDYHVLEYEPVYVIRKSDILEKGQSKKAVGQKSFLIKRRMGHYKNMSLMTGGLHIKNMVKKAWMS